MNKKLAPLAKKLVRSTCSKYVITSWRGMAIFLKSIQLNHVNRTRYRRKKRGGKKTGGRGWISAAVFIEMFGEKKKNNGKFHTGEKQLSIKRHENITRRMTIAFWRIPVRLKILKLVRSITGESCLLRVMGSSCLVTFLATPVPIVNSPMHTD